MSPRFIFGKEGWPWVNTSITPVKGQSVWMGVWCHAPPHVCCVCFITAQCPRAVPLPQDQIYIIYPNEKLVVLLCYGTNFPEKQPLQVHPITLPLAQQPSRVTPPSPQCCPGWPQTPPGDPREILSSWEASSLPMCSSWRLQDCNKLQLPVQSSSPQSVHSNSQHCYIFSCFLHSLCRESQEGPEHAAFLSHTREHSERFTRREMK